MSQSKKTALRRALNLAGLALLSGMLILLFPQTAAAAQNQPPVVQGVMFWEQGCPNCEKVLNETLPPLRAKYGTQLKIDLVEVSTVDDINKLYKIGAAYGLSKEEIGVPLLILGDQALSGSQQIPEKLPGLVEKLLASGGVTTQVRAEPALLVTNPAENSSPSNGMWLGWVTLALLAAALLFAIYQIVLAFQGGEAVQMPAWVEWLTPILAVAGSVVAIYLTFIETTKAKAICGPIGDCNAVQNSPYALLFGVLPVGLLGLIGYIGILASWLWRRFRQDSLSEYVPAALLGMTLFGVVFSVYLTYLEIFVIHAVCIWCISSAWIITILMLINLPEAADWLAGGFGDDAEEPVK